MLSSTEYRHRSNFLAGSSEAQPQLKDHRSSGLADAYFWAGEWGTTSWTKIPLLTSGKSGFCCLSSSTRLEETHRMPHIHTHTHTHTT